MQNAAGSEFVENFYNLFAVNIVLEYFTNYIYGMGSDKAWTQGYSVLLLEEKYDWRGAQAA